MERSRDAVAPDTEVEFRESEVHSHCFTCRNVAAARIEMKRVDSKDVVAQAVANENSDGQLGYRFVRTQVNPYDHRLAASNSTCGYAFAQ